MDNNPPPEQENEAEPLNFEEKKQETRTAVWRLLRFAVSDANKDLTAEKPGLIRKTVPTLLKDPGKLDDNDMAELLGTYNDLSQLIYPATNESLWLKEKLEQHERAKILGQAGQYASIEKEVKGTYNKFRTWLWILVVVFMLFQSYVHVISETLQDVTGLKSELADIDRQIDAARKTINYDHGKENQSPFPEFFAAREAVQSSLDNSYCALKYISIVWGWPYTKNGPNAIACGKPAAPEKAPEPGQNQASTSGQNPQPKAPSMENNARADKNAPARDTLFNGARAFLRVSNYVLLPVLLGLLGALAYVIRGVLDSFSKSSFILGAKRRWGMRVALGPLLGAISGIIVLPDLEEFKGISLSPLVWAFLMGYSVEFAFSLFDTLIEKGRNAIGAGNGPAPEKKPETPAKGVDRAPRINALSPAKGPSSGGTEVAITGAEFADGAQVAFGPAPAQTVKVVSATQITATSPPGEGAVNVTVTTPHGASPPGGASEFVYEDNAAA